MQASFLSGLLGVRGVEAEPKVQQSEKSRQQDADSLDCGAFVCLWMECHAVDSREKWEAAEMVDMNDYRAYIARAFLRGGDVR